MSITYYPGYAQQIITRNLTTQQIASITNANPAIVTTSITNNYVAGMTVTFQIPQAFGMRQLNNQIAQVTNVSGTAITINVDTTNYASFSYPGSLPVAYTPPTMIPYSSGMQTPPPFLPFGNENGFDGCQFNGGSPGDFI